jgi:myo-inositol-1(or 4)-monophosphatase
MKIGDPRVELALKLAQEAGRHTLAAMGRTRVAWKSPGERVTEVDLAVQARLIEEIETRFPGDGVVAEEGARAPGGEHEFVWVLDPLDGTNNYALGVPCFAISIGIIRAGMPWAGVVHDPNTSFLGWAARGRGAYAGGRRLALTPQALHAASNVAMRVPLDPNTRPIALEWLERHKLRNFGSVALHLAYAALGALAVILDHQAALWDVAGGAAILLEAGGRVTDVHGQPLFPFPVVGYRGQPLALLAGNPFAHAEAVAACRAVLKPVR